MNGKTKNTILLLFSCVFLICGVWLLFQGNPESTKPESLNTQPTPTPTITQQATPTPTKKPNMTALETPTQKITRDWYHGSGGGSSRRSPAPITPIPELSTFVFVGMGILTIVIKR